MNTSHYPSLELCKKLTEIGFPEGEIFWSPLPYRKEIKYAVLRKEYSDYKNSYICPSVMEMLDILRHSNEIDKFPYASFLDEDFPDKLAKMVLYGIDKKYISFIK